MVVRQVAYGASVSGTINVTPGEVLQINVGGQGGNTNGGFNGGGNGASSSSNSDNSYGGGGASDIRTAPYQLNNRLVVGCWWRWHGWRQYGC